MATTITNRISTTSSRDKRIQLSPDLRRVLRKIASADLSPRVTFSVPQQWLTLTVDASDSGWGAYWENHAISGLWTSRWTCLSINARELQAIFLALLHWSLDLSNQAVMVFTDNVAAASTIRKRGSAKSLCLSKIQIRIEKLCAHHQIRLQAKHVSGDLNVVADAQSRSSPRPSEWTLHQEKFQEICSWWGVPQVDLCAIPLNAKTKVFVSPLPSAELHCQCPSDQWSPL